MKRIIVIALILFSNFCFSQFRDTTLSSTNHLTKNKSSELSISIFSLGFAIYSSKIKNYMSENDYFNMFFFGFCRNKISTNFLMNLKDITLKDSFNFQNQLWSQGKKLTYFSLGINLDYTFYLNLRLSLKPFAGLSSSNYYLVINGDNKVQQRSNTSFCGQYGITTEYRFKPKNTGSIVNESGDIKWSNEYWSIQWQTGIFPQIFKKNTGIDGHLMYSTIGVKYNVGEYTHLKNNSKKR